MPTYPTISADPRVQAHYERCREEGTPHGLAEMFALGQPPGVETESTFLAGMYDQQAKEFNNKPDVAKVLADDLRAAGGSTAGKVYLGGLAEYPGDPRAWVSGKDDIKQLAKERNYQIDGMVKHKRDGRTEIKRRSPSKRRVAGAAK